MQLNTVVYLKLWGLKWRFDSHCGHISNHMKCITTRWRICCLPTILSKLHMVIMTHEAGINLQHAANNDKNRNCCQYAEVLQSQTDGLQQTVTPYIYVFTTLLNFLALQILVLVVCKRLFLCNYPWIPWLLNTYFLRTVCDESFV